MSLKIGYKTNTKQQLKSLAKIPSSYLFIAVREERKKSRRNILLSRHTRLFFFLLRHNIYSIERIHNVAIIFLI